MSLRWKLAIAVAVLCSAATLVVGAANHRATSERLLAEVDRSLVNAVGALPLDGRGAVARLPVRGPLTAYDAQVLDRTGTVVRSTFDRPATVDPRTAPVLTRPGAQVVLTIDHDDDTYRVLTVGTVMGAVQVARPLDEVQRVLDQLRVRTALAVLVVASVATLLALVIARRATAPLLSLTTLAEHVASTGRLDLDAGVPPARAPVGSDEIGRLSAAFGSMFDALQRSRDEQQRLVDDAGHELRTPLTSIRTNVEVLGRHPDLPADQRAELVADLLAETEELVVLVDEIVTAARGADDEEEVADVVLGDLAREVADRAERRTGRAVRVVADWSVVRAQPAALRRAVANLIDNARKFDRRKAAEPPIEVVVDRGMLEVRDRGPGIADADLSRVFDRFHRSESVRSMPGSGLGLAIVQDVVERNGGTVHARNRTSGGAAVGFALPVVGTREPPEVSPDS